MSATLVNISVCRNHNAEKKREANEIMNNWFSFSKADPLNITSLVTLDQSVCDQPLKKDDVPAHVFNIGQVDGNCSLLSFDLLSGIEIMIGNRPPKNYPEYERISVRRNIKRNNMFFEAYALPVFSLYNMRSVWSKLSNLVEDVQERNCDFSILTEVWESKCKKKHQEALEEVCQMEGFRYFSTPRRDSRRGGGCAVLMRGDSENVTISQL